MVGERSGRKIWKGFPCERSVGPGVRLLEQALVRAPKRRTGAKKDSSNEMRRDVASVTNGVCLIIRHARTSLYFWSLVDIAFPSLFATWISRSRLMMRHSGFVAGMESHLFQRCFQSLRRERHPEHPLFKFLLLLIIVWSAILVAFKEIFLL
jgi:hypothetical protein